MSKPQNPLIKMLQQLGLAKFLGLAPSEKHSHPAPVESPVAESIEATAVSNTETSVAKGSAESVVSVSPAMATQETAEIVMPEDSVLKRHYLSTQDSKREALSHPYPSDSVLRRHYDTEHKLVLDALQAAVVVSKVESVPVQASVQTSSATTKEQAVDKAPVLETVPPVSAAKCCAKRNVLPQDSVLKRHFMQRLTAEIEASLSPSPTDSVLRRHHAALVQSELQKRLAH